MLLRRIKGIRVSLRDLVIILGLVVPCATAYAQTDYSAGKTAAQLFAGDCSVCHKTTRGLVKTRDPRALASFLREHYTSKAESAGALAAYLLGNPAGPADAEARRRQGTPGGAPGTPGQATPGQATPGEEGAAPRQAARGKRQTPAELAREKEAAAKAAEEAAKAKLHGYASTGEAARPLVTEAPPAEATPSAPAATAEPATPPASTEAPKVEPPKAEVGTPPAETSPPAAERPASTPPG